MADDLGLLFGRMSNGFQCFYYRQTGLFHLPQFAGDLLKVLRNIGLYRSPAMRVHGLMRNLHLAIARQTGETIHPLTLVVPLAQAAQGMIDYRIRIGFFLSTHLSIDIDVDRH